MNFNSLKILSLMLVAFALLPLISHAAKIDEATCYEIKQAVQLIPLLQKKDKSLKIQNAEISCDKHEILVDFTVDTIIKDLPLSWRNDMKKILGKHHCSEEGLTKKYGFVVSSRFYNKNGEYIAYSKTHPISCEFR